MRGCFPEVNHHVKMVGMNNPIIMWISWEAAFPWYPAAELSHESPTLLVYTDIVQQSCLVRDSRLVHDACISSRRIADAGVDMTHSQLNHVSCVCLQLCHVSFVTRNTVVARSWLMKRIFPLRALPTVPVDRHNPPRSFGVFFFVWFDFTRREEEDTTQHHVRY